MTGPPGRILPMVWLALAVAGCGRPGGARDGLTSALARAAADEAAALLDGGGSAVLIQIPDTPYQSGDDQAIDDALQSALADRGIRVVAVENLSFDPRIETTGEPFTAGALLEIMQRHADAGILISRVGLPQLTAADLRRFPAPRPRLMVVTNYQVPYLHRLPPGVPDVAIVPRVRLDEAPEAPPDSETELTDFYDIVRPGPG